MASYARLKRFIAHRDALTEVGTSEARKEKKKLSTFKVRAGRTNLNGFYEPTGRHPVRCK